MQSCKQFNLCFLIIDFKPYVPTEKEELQKYKEYLKLQNKTLKENPSNYKRSEKYNGIDASYAGGEDGNEITIHILEKARVIFFFCQRIKS